eukprot:TRINITY_DN8204_c0_g1::TRINITY_DN8204_c0_g1_i1::g.7184::m.7184 TRINITY_DN8204_c0_g1::TRINITY_DN8204_c0_g1_i1::g.7184  ORF type:complete len:199 (+),score=60.13,sp/Q46106/FTN_CAMJE/31.10/1e-14,Ferritin/PF00210.19/1.1e-23,APC8/PF04049.8/0.009,V-ATPase_H_C/PF11698.3/0.049 TRINITY_DN8204_c0_g1_i1:63-599(+)
MVKLSNTLSAAILAQAHIEFQASHTYLQASYWFATRNFDGIASHLRSEAENERTHGLKFLDYLVTREAEDVNLDTIAAPLRETTWDSAIVVFDELTSFEENNTRQLSTLLELAQREKDFAAFTFFQWYIAEQVKGEDELRRIREKVKAYSAMPGLLYHLDAEIKNSAGKPVGNSAIQV